MMSLECNHPDSALERFLHYHFTYIHDDEQMVPVSSINMFPPQMLFENTIK